jgi:hypothetical protein
MANPSHPANKRSVCTLALAPIGWSHFVKPGCHVRGHGIRLTPMNDTWKFIAFCVIGIPIVMFIASNSLPGIDIKSTVIYMLAVVVGGVAILYLLSANRK